MRNLLVTVSRGGSSLTERRKWEFHSNQESSYTPLGQESTESTDTSMIHGEVLRHNLFKLLELILGKEGALEREEPVYCSGVRLMHRGVGHAPDFPGSETTNLPSLFRLKLS